MAAPRLETSSILRTVCTCRGPRISWTWSAVIASTAEGVELDHFEVGFIADAGGSLTWVPGGDHWSRTRREVAQRRASMMESR